MRNQVSQTHTSLPGPQALLTEGLESRFQVGIEHINYIGVKRNPCLGAIYDDGTFDYNLLSFLLFLIGDTRDFP